MRVGDRLISKTECKPYTVVSIESDNDPHYEEYTVTLEDVLGRQEKFWMDDARTMFKEM